MFASGGNRTRDLALTIPSAGVLTSKRTKLAGQTHFGENIPMSRYYLGF
jgi:hypothetical protein